MAVDDTEPVPVSGEMPSQNIAASEARPASGFEIVMARLWNVFNEGKPFTVVFTAGLLVLLSVPHLNSPGYWVDFGATLLALLPLFALFYRYPFPLKLRWALWLYLGVFWLLFGGLDPLGFSVALALYLGFTVFLWGTVYYHIRIGTPWTNFTRFWRLVLENPDPTGGNFLEQVPKVLLLVSGFRYLMQDPSWSRTAGFEIWVVAIGLSAALLHRWLFTWVPAPSLVPTRHRNTGAPVSGRFILIVIDGCRADRLREAYTPCIDRLRARGTEFTRMRAVYPARTVTCFSSMLSGARPEVHGMRSNFVPSLGIKCDSLFSAADRQRRRGRMVGIAHLVDAFGDGVVRTVTSVAHNDVIDDALVKRAKGVLLEEDPELLVVQLISVDQTGHARGSYNAEYLKKIEDTDRVIEDFLDWCETEGYLDGATVMITADHGQGIGIGGHGYLGPGELYVPCILWGEGVAPGRVYPEPRSIMDIAPTISYFLGIDPPQHSTGQVLLIPAQPSSPIEVRGDLHWQYIDD